MRNKIAHYLLGGLLIAVLISSILTVGYLIAQVF